MKQYQLGVVCLVVASCSAASNTQSTTGGGSDPWQGNNGDSGQHGYGSHEQSVRNADIAAGSNAPPILAAHNAVRAKHCVPPLRWSDTLAGIAQQWANRLAGQGCALIHQQNNRYGENLAMMGGGTMTADNVVAMWYGEIGSYDYNSPGFAMDTGHFTQVVWKNSTELGCARASCDNGEVWVCQYNPPGNFEGEYPAQVPQVCRR